MQLGIRTTPAVSRTVRLGGIRRLRYARRAFQGRRDGRVRLQTAADPQADPRGPARRHPAQHRATTYSTKTASSPRFSRAGINVFRWSTAAKPPTNTNGVRASARRSVCGCSISMATATSRCSRPGGGDPLHSLNDATVSIGIRLSKNEAVFRRPFDKKYLRIALPRRLAHVHGRNPRSAARKPGVLRTGGQHPLPGQPAAVRLLDDLDPGRTALRHIPYPLLKLHEGNGTYFYDPHAFSCMNYYEFASDSWVS